MIMPMLIRDIEGNPKVRVLRQMYNEGSIDINEFGYGLRQVRESY